MSEIDVLPEYIDKLNVELFNESPRASVIFAAAIMDNYLQKILEKCLIKSPTKNDKLLDSDKPLGTLSARIEMTFRLGIIDKEFRDTLHIIRKIRNDFAHQLIEGNLENPPYSDRINILYCSIKSFWKYVSPFSTLFQSLQKSAEIIADNITRYKLTAFFLIIRLEEISKIDKLLNIEKPKKIIPQWVRNLQGENK